MPESLFAHHLPPAIDHLRKADPILAALVDRIEPPQIAVEEDRFLSLVSAIVNQQLSGRAAATIEGRLLALFPDGATSAALLSVPAERLREAGLSGAKARYLRDLAEQVTSGALDLEAIGALGDEEVITQLTRVKGIGRWTAEMFLIFSLGRADVLPVGDLGFRAALRRHYGLAELPGSAQCQAIAAPWRPYCSIATLYLWRSLAPPAAASG